MQVAFAPLRVVYHVVGARAMSHIQTHIIDPIADSSLGLGNSHLSVPLAVGLAATTGASVLLVMAGPWRKAKLA